MTFGNKFIKLAGRIWNIFTDHGLSPSYSRVYGLKYQGAVSIDARDQLTAILQTKPLADGRRYHDAAIGRDG